ncbi:hypothetical protein QJS10_CPB11g01328 [Acorus calamus]|uniref:Uncharacterized protein n=1 Tax=Acorus calamus TaxID=4465 RepID=A0AAV9DTE1_ACOCL|nr:hypothetical protein QJS10_CPB11g01328 [Acorus calamus]
MADFSAPSFSLGLDLDPDSYVPDSEDEEPPEVEDSPLRPVLKRLRRGPPPPPSDREESTRSVVDGDEDIEEFSSQEEPNTVAAHSATQIHSACSTSKFSLLGHGILKTQSRSDSRFQKLAAVSNASTPRGLEDTRNSKLPETSISPLRKIQLIDSDSDESSFVEIRGKDARKGSACSENNWRTPVQYATGSQQTRAKISSKKFQTDSFWKDFSPKKNLETPAFDEFCEEYFQSVNIRNTGPRKEGNIIIGSSRVLDQNESMNQSKAEYQDSMDKHQDRWSELPDPQLPAFRYFYHDDPRIRELVRNRLPNFIPLGTVNHIENQHLDTTDLGYMGHFGPRNVHSQGARTGKNGTRGGSKKHKRTSKNSTNEEISNSSMSFVNPRACASIPKDAGKRRVRADGRSGGHWYTGQDGRKVYVTKNGQELSGQTAYRHYRKDSGAGYKRSKKKTAAKKKSKR